MSLQELKGQKIIAGLLPAVFMLAFSAGCSDPSVIGRFRATPVTNIILDSLGVVDEEPEQFAGARKPKPRDLQVQEREYVIHPGDVLDISIFDLFQAGQPWINRMQVSETGRITVPEIGTFRVAGRTELELTDDIKYRLSPHIIKDPTVNVVVTGATAKVFSISGAIAAPSRYPLMEPDFRMMEALAQAGGIPQMGVDYAYVVREVDEEDIETAGQAASQRPYDSWETGQTLPPAPSPGAVDRAIRQRSGEITEQESSPTKPVKPWSASPGEREKLKPAFEKESMESPPTPSGQEPSWSPGESAAPDNGAILRESEPLPEESLSVPGAASREQEPEVDWQEPIAEEKKITPKRERDNLLESISPVSLIISPAEMAEPPEYDSDIPIINPFGEFGGKEDEQISSDNEAKRYFEEVPPDQSPPIKPLKVIRRGGRFHLVPAEGEVAPAEPVKPKPPRRPEEFVPSEPTWPIPAKPREPGKPVRERRLEELGAAGQYQEVVRIDLKALQSGDLTQNIVIRPGDHIQVQFNNLGVFYVMGQVARPGPYSLSGDRMTLKQAMVVGGPLSPVASPSRCDVIRRIGRDKEVTYRVNLQKLFDGTVPDVFIKPNDIINVGSHPVARWVAVIRQSFRSTYGFGFVYDRNMADKDFGH